MKTSKFSTFLGLGRLSSLQTVFVALFATSFLAASCASEPRRYTNKQAKTSLKKLDSAGLVIGEFPITKITDGDTIRVSGLDSSMRLLCVDTEETFKNDQDRRDADTNFEGYLKKKRGESYRPVKAATPIGEEAKKFAMSFFEGVTTVRLERDIAGDIRDRYDRYLAYVFVTKNGKEYNYNIESVREGMSPYFTKYGYSRRFHADFMAAEEEARAAKRGIWNPATEGYTDYEERKPWWDARGEFLQIAEKAFEGYLNFIVLTFWDTPRRLAELKDKEVIILATVGAVYPGDKGPTRVTLSRQRGGDFPLIFFDQDVFTSTAIGEWRGEFVLVRGVITEYQNKHTKKRQLQIVVTSPDQIVLSPIPGLKGSTPATFLQDAIAKKSAGKQ